MVWKKKKKCLPLATSLIRCHSLTTWYILGFVFFFEKGEKEFCLIYIKITIFFKAFTDKVQYMSCSSLYGLIDTIDYVLLEPCVFMINSNNNIHVY